LRLTVILDPARDTLDVLATHAAQWQDRSAGPPCPDGGAGDLVETALKQELT
jgi:hypothetical protein